MDHVALMKMTSSKKTRKKKSLKKEWIIRIALLVASISIVLLLFELAARIYYSGDEIYERYDDLLEFNNLTGVRLKPNLDVIYSSKFGVRYHIMTNQFGWRDDALSYQRSKPHRVQIYGDSFVEGVGVDQSDLFTELLEKKYLNDTEVMNFGLAAMGTSPEYVHYEIEGNSTGSDIVVLVFYIPDLVDNVYEYLLCPYYELVNASLLLRNFPSEEEKFNQYVTNAKVNYSSLVRVHAFLSEHSYAYDLFSTSIHSIGFIRRIIGHTASGKIYYLGIGRDYIYLTNESEDYRRSLRITGMLLENFSNLAKMRNQSLYVVIIPTKEQIYREEWDAFMQATDHETSLMDRDKPVHDLLLICDRLGLACIDLLPVFRSSGQRLYFDLDQHTNKQGHDLIAGTISERLIADGVVGPALNRTV
ncbi:MAG: hypothetical protein V1866_05720 [archaeon]